MTLKLQDKKKTKYSTKQWIKNQMALDFTPEAGRIEPVI